jgi:hypothetical protein
MWRTQIVRFHRNRDGKFQCGEQKKSHFQPSEKSYFEM